MYSIKQKKYLTNVINLIELNQERTLFSIQNISAILKKQVQTVEILSRRI